jgi:hypothetical protein
MWDLVLKKKKKKKNKPKPSQDVPYWIGGAREHNNK